jgi:putative aldouronate transport system substrate-binding protein
MKKRSKGIAVAFVMAAAMSVWTGCGKPPTDSKVTAVDRSNFNEMGTYPLVKEKETITVMATATYAQFDAATNVMCNYYEEMTNVHINWINVPREQIRERVNLALASGDQIDFIVCPGTTFLDLAKFAGQGVILPIQDYIESDTVNMKKILNDPKYDGWRQAVTLPDGGIYGMPGLSEVVHGQHYGKMWVNKEFLKNVGMQIPTTTEEFHAMLTAFKNLDANGNGDPNDEIPFAGAIGDFYNKVDTYLMNAFVYDDGEDRLFLDNGKVTASFTKSEFHDGLRYLRQLYTEGLIYPDSFTMSSDDRATLNSRKYESIIGAVPFCVTSGVGFREGGQPVRWVDYEVIPPVKGPKGVQTTQYSPYGKFSGSTSFIPVTCKNPALMLRFVDYFYTQEGMNLFEMGAPGYGQFPADPGAVGPDGSLAKYRKQIIPRDSPFYGNLKWAGDWTCAGPAEWRNAIQTASDILAPDGSGTEGFLYQKTLTNYVPYAPPVSTIMPPLIYSEDVISEFATLRTNINAYVEESIARFIRGDLNVETDWNRFQTELKNLGIDRYFQIIQTTYDKSLFAVK